MTDSSHAFKLEDLEVRLAEDRDHQSVLELFQQGELEGKIPDNDTGADIENLQEGYFSDDGHSAFWVACLGDVVVGMIGVQRTHENTAEMRRLRVRREYRRRGVGTKLLEHAMNFCNQRGHLKVVLDVRIERGPAIALFENFGFSIARTREIGDRRLLEFYLDLYRDPRGG